MKRKNYFTFVVTLVLCLALLAGCADKPSKPTDTAPIKLGGIGPLTGGAAVYGLSLIHI